MSTQWKGQITTHSRYENSIDLADNLKGPENCRSPWATYQDCGAKPFWFHWIHLKSDRSRVRLHFWKCQVMLMLLVWTTLWEPVIHNSWQRKDSLPRYLLSIKERASCCSVWSREETVPLGGRNSNFSKCVLQQARRVHLLVIILIFQWMPKKISLDIISHYIRFY